MPLRDIDYQLLDAARAGDLLALQAALDKGANASANDDRPGTNGETAIHLACTNGHIPSIELLLHYDVLAKDNHGQLPIHYAVLRGQINAVQLLLDDYNEFYVNDEDNHGCCKYDDLIHTQDESGKTLLFLAIQNGQAEMAMFLLEKGATFIEGRSSNNRYMHSSRAKFLTEIINGNIREIEHILNSQFTCDQSIIHKNSQTDLGEREVDHGLSYSSEDFLTIGTEFSKKETCQILECALYVAAITKNISLLQRLIDTHNIYVCRFTEYVKEH